jgi:hypothetical protein
MICDCPGCIGQLDSVEIIGAIRITYHNGCIEQDMPHCGHILQHHGNPERSNYFERSMEVIVLRQCNEILGTFVSHRNGSDERPVLTLL